MKKPISQWDVRQRGLLLVLLALAPHIVEATVATQETQAASGHLYTLSDLMVYKVFRGAVPAVLRVAEAGASWGCNARW